MTKYDLWRAELLCWDNEGGEGGEGGSGEGGDGGGTTDAGEGAGGGSGGSDPKAGQTTNPATGKTFTQEEVNKFVAERNKSLKSKFEAMEKSYDTLLKQQNLTNEQRQNLESQLEAVQREMMTKEQQQEADRKKAQQQHETELKKAQEEAVRFKTLFETSTIERAITDAASKHEAYAPNQFVSQLKPLTQMVEEVDADGKLTGNLVPRIEWKTSDEDGKIHVSHLAPEEAVVKMKEDVDTYGNLFKPNVTAGIGSGTAPGQLSSAGKVDQARISDAEYMELASTPEGRRKLGLER